MQLKPVSDTIISLDKDVNGQGNGKGTIDGKLCKSGYDFSSVTTEGQEKKDTCGVSGGSSHLGRANEKGLSYLWTKANSTSTGGGNYVDSKASGTVGPHTSATISKDMSELTSSEKGIVSSAFAKAHEGAEIVIAVDIHL